MRLGLSWRSTSARRSLSSAWRQAPSFGRWGPSALHAQGGRLPWFYSSPLLLLGWSVIFGVAFIVRLIYCYEQYQHYNPHTRLAYSINETLGFSSLACFCSGYILLIFLVTRG